MLNRLILKVTKFQLPPPKRLGTVVKNIFAPPPMSNRVKPTFTKYLLTLNRGLNYSQHSLLFFSRTKPKIQDDVIKYLLSKLAIFTGSLTRVPLSSKCELVENCVLTFTLTIDLMPVQSIFILVIFVSK